VRTCIACAHALLWSLQCEFTKGALQVDNEVLEAAHLLMRPLCLRRLKEDVETTLPPKVLALLIQQMIMPLSCLHEGACLNCKLM
jgi:SNF2 family DNA or RNA helicase